MRGWQRTCAALAAALFGLAGCGDKEVVTVEDPEGMRLRQQMVDQFTRQQEQVTPNVAPAGPGEETDAP